MSHQAPVTLSIPNGGTDSPALSALWSKGMVRSGLGNSESIGVSVPAALTGVCTVQVSPQYKSGNWRTLQEGGADLALAAGKFVRLPLELGIEDIRIHSAGAEGAQRDFVLSLQIDMD